MHQSRSQKYLDEVVASELTPEEYAVAKERIEMGIECVVKSISAFENNRHQYIDWTKPITNRFDLQCTATEAKHLIMCFTEIAGRDLTYTANTLNTVLAWMVWTNFIYVRKGDGHIACENKTLKKARPQQKINKENGVYAAYVPDGIYEYVLRKMQHISAEECLNRAENAKFLSKGH